MAKLISDYRNNLHFLENSIFVIDEAHNLAQHDIGDPQQSKNQTFKNNRKSYFDFLHLFDTLQSRKIILSTATPIIRLFRTVIIADRPHNRQTQKKTIYST